MGRLVNRRIRLFLMLLAFAFAGLFVRAAWLQGIRAQSLSRLGQTQHREEVTVPATRGTIFDRAGIPLGRLPGDINYRGKNAAFFFPITTCIILSIVLSLVMWIVNRFFR